MIVFGTGVLALLVQAAFFFGPYFMRPHESARVARSKGSYAGLGLDQAFAENIKFWPTGTIETLYFATEILRRLSGSSWARHLKHDVLEFVERCYDPPMGLYRSTPNAGQPNMRTTHCAIGTLKALEGIEPSVNFQRSRAGDKIGHSDEVLSNATAFLSTAIAQRADLPDVYSATTLAWNCRHDGPGNIGYREEFKPYLESLLVLSDGIAAFRSGLDSSTPCISATFFATRLARGQDIFKELIRLVGPNHLEAFLWRCWHEDEGGFSSHPRSSPNLVHTRMALELCEAFNFQTLYSRRQVMRFVSRCRSDYGLSFAPGLEPNIYALRCGLEILEQLSPDGYTNDEIVKEIGWSTTQIVELVAQRYRKLVSDLPIKSPLATFAGYPALDLRDRLIHSLVA